MRSTRIAMILAFIIFSSFTNAEVCAQYPAKPVTMIVGWGAGGSTDLTMRALCEAAGKVLGQPIVVVNKPGGGSSVALALLKNEKPDGYTLGNISANGITGQHLQKVPYDALKDFTPIIRYGDYSLGLAVRADAPWKTFKEFVAYAKANSGKIKYTTPGAGGTHHLVMEALAREVGIKWIHMPSKGGHEAVTTVLGGHVDAVNSPSEWKPYVDNGSMRLLATYRPERLPKYPNVPTWLELGYPISSNSLVGILGPKGLPAPVVEKLHHAFKQSLDDPVFKKVMDSLDMPIIYRNPEGLYKDMKEMNDRWGGLIREMGLKP